MANPRTRYGIWRGPVALLAAGGCVALACSSNDNPGGGGSGGMAPGTGGTTSSAGTSAKGGLGGTGGTTGGTGGPAGTGGAAMAGTGATGTGGTTTTGGSGSGGSSTTGGSAGTAAAGAPGGGAPGAGSGGTSSGATGGAGMTGSGGAPMAGSGGAHAGGSGGSGGASTASFTCNQVIGIDSTSEWYMAGFETYVPDGKWQLIYHHPGYIEDWGDANDDVWKTSVTTVTSPCSMNSTNPDRVIFNMFADGSDTSITNKAAFAAGLDKVITQIKAHYSNLKRIDLLTMTRAPMNMACSSSNAAGSTIPQYEDDAVQMEVASGSPSVVASPPFFAAEGCSDFDSTGGPHFSDAGKPLIAKLYGMYYASEP